MNAIHRWNLGLVIVVACIASVPFLCVGGVIGIAPLITRPGIGNVEQAKTKIQKGMSKDEVRSLLGEPHLTGANGGDEWDYWETRFVGSILRIYFGSDGRVTSRESWCQ